MKKNNKKNLGFTLIELLISIAIIITSATVVVGIITSTFRSSSKTNSSEQTRIAGDSALNQVSTLLQYSDGFEGAWTIGDDGTETAAVCNTSISDDTSVDEIKFSYGGSTHSLACANDELELDRKSLININQFSVDSCDIICTQLNTVESPLIGIQFVLSEGDSSSQTQSATQATDFSRTIKMKNLNQ